MGRLTVTIRPEPQITVVRDLLGPEVRPGMLLAYARRAGSDHWLNVLQVTAVDMGEDGEGTVGFATGLIIKSSRVKPSRHGLRYQVEILPQRVCVRHAVVVWEGV